MEQTITSPRSLKFRALAEHRVSSVIRTIRRIGTLSRRASYDYTPEQIAKMFVVMRAELDAAEQKFAVPDKREQPPLFRLD